MYYLARYAISAPNPLDFLRSETDAEMARQLAIVLNRNFKLTSGDALDSGFFANAGDQLAQAIFMLARGTCFPDIMMCHAILSLPKLIDRIEQASLNPWVKVAFDQFLSVAGSPETAASIVGTTSGLFTRFMIPSTLSGFCGQTNIPLDLKGRKMVVFGMDKEKRDVIAPLSTDLISLKQAFDAQQKTIEQLEKGLEAINNQNNPPVKNATLHDWINSIETKAKNTAKNLYEQVKTALTPKVDKVKAQLETQIVTLKEQMNQQMESLKTEMRSQVAAVKNEFESQVGVVKDGIGEVKQLVSDEIQHGMERHQAAMGAIHNKVSEEVNTVHNR
ncbi:hypothetical protein LC612_42575 [Nostoc sp. CHAB 5834]|nr:hypothetical protein [Nostoc sp. CHAB 5834]